jgi:hypothetical protein
MFQQNVRHAPRVNGSSKDMGQLAYAYDRREWLFGRGGSESLVDFIASFDVFVSGRVSSEARNYTSRIDNRTVDSVMASKPSMQCGTHD